MAWITVNTNFPSNVLSGKNKDNAPNETRRWAISCSFTKLKGKFASTTASSQFAAHYANNSDLIKLHKSTENHDAQEPQFKLPQLRFSLLLRMIFVHFNRNISQHLCLNNVNSAKKCKNSKKQSFASTKSKRYLARHLILSSAFAILQCSQWGVQVGHF